MKQKLQKNMNAIVTISMGLSILLGTYLINKFTEIDDVFITVLIVFAIIVLINGLLQFIKGICKKI